jgi:hypothetical protein
MKIYVASSWRNDVQPDVVEALRANGHEVYDFRAPDPGGTIPGGFQWSEIDPLWRTWTPLRFIEAIEHPLAEHGFSRDFRAMEEADACVMVQPCGVSAALELGWMIGAGKQGVVLLTSGTRFEPELMLAIARGRLCVSIDEVLLTVRALQRRLDAERAA